MNEQFKDQQYYMEHPAEFDALGDDARVNFLNGVFEPIEEGETEAEKVIREAAEKAAAAGGEGGEKVILAKDGDNVIPYSELEDSRKAEQEAKVEVERLQGIVDENTTAISTLTSNLEAAKLKDEVDGGAGNEAQKKILDDFKSDYAEIFEAVTTLVGNEQSELGDKLSALEGQVKTLTEHNETQAAETVAKTEAQEANDVHLKAIGDAHPDFQQIYGSEEMAEWMKNQPSYVQVITKEGSTEQVIELFQSFKDANPEGAWAKDDKGNTLTAKEQAAKDEEARKKAALAVDGAVADPPASLSEIAGGTVHHDEREAMQSMNGMQLMGKFEGKTNAQIDAMMNKAL